MLAPSDRSMFLKIVLVIVTVGAAGCGLLVARHQRAQAAHELAAARLRILRTDARLASLRAHIAVRVSPDGVAGMAEHLGPTVPLLSRYIPRFQGDEPRDLALGANE